MITVYIKLMGSLLPFASQGKPGLIEITLEHGATVQEAIQALEIPQERIKLIFVNHIGAYLSRPLMEGDRVSLFPAEYPVFADWEGSILKEKPDSETE